MAHSKLIRTVQRSSAIFVSTATLALWRLRRTWGMLFFTSLGTIAAVMMVCTVPLYSQVALTAGLRGVLTANRDSATLLVNTNIAAISTSSVGAVKSVIDQSLMGTGLQSYISGPQQFVIQTDGLTISKPKLPNSSDTMAISGYSMKDVAKHAKIVRGRFPNILSNDLEVALTPDTALGFHVDIGSTIVVQFPVSLRLLNESTPLSPKTENLQLHVVGIYNADVTDDVFWHGANIDLSETPGLPPALSGTALVSSDTFLSVLDSFDAANNWVISTHLTNLEVYYQLNTSHLSITQLDDLIATLSNWQDTLTNSYDEQQLLPDFPYIHHINALGYPLTTATTQSTLEQYRSRIGVLQIPNFLLLFQIITLILFFVGMMTELLVERQSDTIAILRSRGANRLQIFGSFMTQSIGIGVVALCIGPFLAILAVNLIGQRILTSQEQEALNIISHDPISIIYSLRSYALITVLLAIVTMDFSIYRTVGMDVLAIRRASARTMIRPLWQQLNLDIAAVIVAITGYFVSQYVTGLQQLNLQANVLIASPLALISPLFLVIAGILLFLRLFPILLRLGSSLAARGRGASAMLALGQVSRAPRQLLRMTLLLSLASAFSIFALVFTSSQQQHMYDLAAYQVGADFSGSTSYDSLQNVTDQTSGFVKQTHGVLSATLGYAAYATTGPNGYTFEVRGVDANTFAQTATWTQANSTQSLSSLMQMLAARRGDVAKSQLLPALVDEVTWQRLRLSVGKHFSLYTSDEDGTQGSPISYIAVAEIEHISTVQSSGLLFDYQSGDKLYHLVPENSLPRNYLWVKTSDDPASIASVRNALTTAQPRIIQLADRRVLVEKLSTDPLYLDLLGVLALGAITALLLALVGNLLASWLSARNRVTNFAVLRALGTSPQQVVGVLTWEQGITYVTSIILGIVFGTLFSATTIPLLVFSSVPNNELIGASNSDKFYALQHVIPTYNCACQPYTCACYLYYYLRYRVRHDDTRCNTASIGANVTPE